MKALVIGFLGAAGCLTSAGWAAAASTKDSTPLFETDVASILRVRCWKCHGMEDRKAGLDLRTPPLALKGGDKGPVIVPGSAEQSLLFKKAASGAMPPGKATKLTPDQVETLRRWIDGGAKAARTYTLTKAETREVTPQDRKHWAFQKLAQPEIPKIRSAAGAINPVDRFLLAKLESKGLSYAPGADPYTLVRRAYLDLIGLPPTPEEQAAFAQDKSPDAYEKLIDRLLASPHFGERWGRHWLDAAGYADLQGSDLLNTRSVKVTPDKWRYRDYVIRSLNNDKPYDRFLHEQIAGDELVAWRTSPKITPEMLESIDALGFLRCAADDSNAGMGGVAEARFRMVQLTIQNLTSNVMGMTVACAQCHSHKFDPIPQVDYYRMMAILEPAFNIQDWVLPANRWIPGVTPKEKDQIDKFNQELNKRIAPLQKQMAEIGQPYLEKQFSREMRNLAPSLLKDLKAALALESGKRDSIQTYLADHFGPILAIVQKMPPVPEALIKNDQAIRQDSFIFKRQPGVEFKSKFVPMDITMDENEKALAKLFQPVLADTLTARALDDDKRTELQKYIVSAFQRTSTITAERLVAAFKPDDLARYLAVEAQTEPINAQRKSYPTIPAAYDVNKPGTTYLLRRGDLETPAEEVQPGMLSVLYDSAKPVKFPAWDEQQKTSFRRLTLAKWLTEPDTPASALVARVMVNKIWMHLFGEGIVPTADNFGVNGTPPTHPALLDWMAGQFMRDGWRVKPMIKMMMMSSGYQQASSRADRDKATAADPSDALLWRMRIKRLESEIIRDQTLSVAGKLDLKMGGEAVRLDYRDDGYVGFSPRDKSGQYRRSLYLFTRRGHNLTMLKDFDQPAMDASCVRRSSSSVVLQSLAMLNGEETLRSANDAGARVMKIAGTTPEERVKASFQIVLNRPAEAKELAWGVESLKRFDDDEKKAVAALCHTLMNTSEFLYTP